MMFTNNSYNTYIKEVKELENANESLDSHSKITKTEYEKGFKFYYFDINDKKFRVILEDVDDETGINFEQLINDDYTTSGVSNNLSAKESMMLFGTVLYIIKNYSITKHFSIFTDNIKKFRVYLRILIGKGAKNLRYKPVYNGKAIQIEFELEEMSWLDKKIKKFRYKAF